VATDEFSPSVSDLAQQAREAATRSRRRGIMGQQEPEFPVDPGFSNMDERLAQTVQNFYNSMFGSAEQLGRATFAGNLDPTDPQTAGAALRTAPWAAGGAIPRVPPGLEEMPISPELAEHARRQAEYVFNLQHDRDNIAATHHAMEVEDKAPHGEYYSKYLDRLWDLQRQYGMPEPLEEFPPQEQPPRGNVLPFQRPAPKIGEPGSLSGLTRSMQVPSQFVSPIARRSAILNKLAANRDWQPQITEGRLRFRSLTAAENKEMSRVGWSRAPEVTHEQEISPDPLTRMRAWQRNIEYWRRLAGPQE
jgi:hypothetical protein